MAKLDWESIESNMGEFYRCKVIGGWLIMSQNDVTHDTRQQGLQSGWDWRNSVTFVPDALGLWE